VKGLERCLPGFESIERGWNSEHGLFAARILPGEFYVTESDEVLTTLLGSCVAACIRDPRTGFGGMNHFMLPVGGDGSSTAWLERASTRYGNYAMERLLNELLKLGARREELEVKLAGGGRMYESNGDVGSENARFALRYVSEEGLRLVARDLGGAWPRRVQYFPSDGRMRVLRLPPVTREVIVTSEMGYRETLENQGSTGSVRFF